MEKNSEKTFLEKLLETFPFKNLPHQHKVKIILSLVSDIFSRQYSNFKRLHLVMDGIPGAGKSTIAKVFCDIMKGLYIRSGGTFSSIKNALKNKYQMHRMIVIDEADNIRNWRDKFLGFLVNMIDGENVEVDRNKYIRINSLIWLVANDLSNYIIYDKYNALKRRITFFITLNREYAVDWYEDIELKREILERKEKFEEVLIELEENIDKISIYRLTEEEEKFVKRKLMRSRELANKVGLIKMAYKIYRSIGGVEDIERFVSFYF